MSLLELSGDWLMKALKILPNNWKRSYEAAVVGARVMKDIDEPGTWTSGGVFVAVKKRSTSRMMQSIRDQENTGRIVKHGSLAVVVCTCLQSFFVL